MALALVRDDKNTSLIPIYFIDLRKATIIPAIPTIVGACGVPYEPSDLVASVPTSVFQP